MRTQQSMAMAAALVIAAGLSACASAPQRNDQLDQARVAVRSLEEDPNAQQAAPEQLRDATSNLELANTAFEKNESPDQVTYLAYLADREAQAGKAQAEAYRASQELARGSEERNRILLEARTEEAQQARASAASQADQAQFAREQAQQERAVAQNQADQAQVAREQAQQAQAERAQMQAQLQKEQQALSDLKAQQTARGLELTLASDLLFNTGGSTLKAGATLQLNRLADFMRANPQTRIIVEGYTDSRGSAEYNEALSTRRAQAVANELVTQGIAMDRVQTIGRGKDYPVASNDTPEGRQQNRRVDIVLSDMSGQFAPGARQAPEPQ